MSAFVTQISEFFKAHGKDFVVIGVTIAVFAIFVWGYFNLANPTIVLTKPAGPVNKCPDLRIYDDKKNECRPSYDTNCKPFDPDFYQGQECDIAKSCGTSWKGLCK